MKRQLAILISLLFTQNGFPVEAVVGGRHLNIPAPDGCQQITRSMRPYADILTSSVPPSNEQHLVFIPNDDVAAAARGEIPQPRIAFTVQSSRAVLKVSVAQSDFQKFKATIKRQNDEVFRKAAALVPGLMERLTKALAGEAPSDLRIAMANPLPLPPHYETDRSIAYSALAKLSAKQGTREGEEFDAALTTTILHVQDTILFLYATTARYDVSACRAESRKWADAILAANPSMDASYQSKSSSSARSLDSRCIRSAGIIASAIAAVLAVAGYMYMRRSG